MSRTQSPRYIFGFHDNCNLLLRRSVRKYTYVDIFAFAKELIKLAETPDRIAIPSPTIATMRMVGDDVEGCVRMRQQQMVTTTSFQQMVTLMVVNNAM